MKETITSSGQPIATNLRRLHRQFRRAQANLSPVERDVLALRLGVKDKHSRTLQETCRQFAMTPAEVRGMEQKLVHQQGV